MAFPPRFLDELRERVSLADIVGRRVKHTRRGREYIGLCPFHNEKTPSFSVVEDKGFYHCFGCGAHGDVIGFAMQTENLTFPEAVEQLARKAGLPVPQSTPEERQREERAQTLQGAVEAACVFFETQLREPGGSRAREYLAKRGLDESSWKRFRLGYAPDRNDALKLALGGKFPEALLVEAGLLHKSDDGRTFDYFRGRVIFPIGNRRGAIIAFGGRVLDDSVQPKYLNSPDTPLFAKGRVLYGLASARAAAAREPSAIVAEGYMDVIALRRAGFHTAVAPLGTALTETQIEELWKLSPEPVLCFDGDTAGQRAASRALERALPLLRPGFSLRFATLPVGEDPDTLIARQGAAAMRGVLDQARPLAEVLWTIETSHPLKTPEQRAALEQRLETQIRRIADRSVQEHYRNFFRTRLAEVFNPGGNAGARPSGRLGWGRFAPWRVGPIRRPGRGGGPLRGGAAYPAHEKPPEGDPGLLQRRAQEVLLALLLNHPFLLAEVGEELAQFELPDRALDRLCREILRLHSLHPDLDAAALKLHLSNSGFGQEIAGILTSQVLNHAGFARPGADAEDVRLGWSHTKARLQERRLLSTQISEAERQAADGTDETWSRLQPLLQSKAEDDGAAGGGMD